MQQGCCCEDVLQLAVSVSGGMRQLMFGDVLLLQALSWIHGCAAAMAAARL
jgi:hypothetical protein